MSKNLKYLKTQNMPICAELDNSKKRFNSSIYEPKLLKFIFSSVSQKYTTFLTHVTLRAQIFQLDHELSKQIFSNFLNTLKFVGAQYKMITHYTQCRSSPTTEMWILHIANSKNVFGFTCFYQIFWKGFKLIWLKLTNGGGISFKLWFFTKNKS